ncbi:MAG TPA: hypothetical protein VH853_23840 [Polyangia bacterium]|nr:hypothetical protein [Polyangia bacterium]
MTTLKMKEGRMVRKSCFILGIALGIFWWIGLSENQGATALWFDAVAAVLAFGTAALLAEPERNPSRAFGPALIGLGLAIVWVVGLSTGQPVWASWMNFAFAVAFLGLAVAAVLQPRLAHVRHR